MADGTTGSMPDTRANQRAYPQPDAQEPGLGFPIARAVVVFGLATGAVIDAALGRYHGKRTGEAALLRQLAEALESGDVVLGDRGFGSFYELALWQARGVDAVVRLHQARRADFRTGRRLGPKDHVVVWGRPDRPAWLDETTYAALPRTLAVREVAVRMAQRGFRTRRPVVVTTLRDATAYPARRHAEISHPNCRSSGRLYLSDQRGTIGRPLPELRWGGLAARFRTAVAYLRHLDMRVELYFGYGLSCTDSFSFQSFPHALHFRFVSYCYDSLVSAFAGIYFRMRNR